MESKIEKDIRNMLQEVLFPPYFTEYTLFVLDNYDNSDAFLGKILEMMQKQTYILKIYENT